MLKENSNSRLSKNLVSALVSKGDELLEKDKFNEAIPYFKRASEMDNNQSYAFYGLAKCYECLKDNDNARENYEKALEIDSENKLYKSDYEKFSETVLAKVSPKLEENLKSQNKNKNENQDENENQKTDTLKSLKPVQVSDFPQTPEQMKTSETTTNIEKSFNKTEEAAKKIENTEVAEKAENIDADTLIKEGDNLYKSGKNTEAIEKYIEALKVNPNDFVTAFKTGNLYKLDNNSEKAIIYYKKATDANKNYTDAWFNMGLVYASLNDYKNSKECFNKVISLKPDYAYSYYALALSYENEKNYKKAIENYQKYYNLENDDLTKKAVVKKINELQSKQLSNKK